MAEDGIPARESKVPSAAACSAADWNFALEAAEHSYPDSEVASDPANNC